MSFWDQNPQFDRLHAQYLNGDGKKALVDSQETFKVVNVVEDFENEYQGKADPRWEIFIERQNGDWEIIPMSRNKARDMMFGAMAAHISTFPDQPIYCCLGYVELDNGNGFYTLENPEPKVEQNGTATVAGQKLPF